MAASDPVEEWRRLNALYSEMGDTELLELKASFDDLTELAQSTLRDEMKKRHLWDLPLPEDHSPSGRPDDSEDGYDPFQHIGPGGVTVGEYDTVNEAKLASYVLDLAGINAVMADPNGSFNLSLPIVRVAPDDAEKAVAILAQPVSAKIRADFEATRNLPDFEAPACPRCSCNEVLLAAFEPNNRWLCGDCGHRWEDAAQENSGIV